jgi:outer membrane protein assembly factor BamB
VLYAMNGTNGAALWNSGQTMTAALSGRSFWSATGQVYVGTTDGVVYAFGYPMERD